MKSVLFVCTGNTCRSPLAEAVARTRLGAGAGVACASAGLYALEEAPATPHTLAVAAELGIALDDHRADEQDALHGSGNGSGVGLLE